RNPVTRVGPSTPGVGLAQWTTGGRRSGLFAYHFGDSELGASALFNMDGQIDYLVHELRTKPNFAAVQNVLSNPATNVDGASDEVLYDFEIPGAILQGGKKLPRTNTKVQQTFSARRPLARRAHDAFVAAHPSASWSGPHFDCTPTDIRMIPQEGT